MDIACLLAVEKIVWFTNSFTAILAPSKIQQVYFTWHNYKLYFWPLTRNISSFSSFQELTTVDYSSQLTAIFPVSLVQSD